MIKNLEEVMGVEFTFDNYESGRKEVFKKIQTRRIWNDWQYDYLNLVLFLRNPKKYCDQHDANGGRQLYGRVKAAEWNDDEYRHTLMHIVASFESKIAYYATIKPCVPDADDLPERLMNEIYFIVECMVNYASELESLVRLENIERVLDDHWDKLMMIWDGTLDGKDESTVSMQIALDLEGRASVKARLHEIHKERAENECAWWMCIN